MYYTVYMITNLINDHKYIGIHRTKDPYDKYVGSGKLIKQAIKKHGRENFIKEVLFVFDNEDDMCNKEAELVNEEWVKSPTTYNAKTGGIGGFSHINDGGPEHIARAKRGGTALAKKYIESEYYKKIQDKTSDEYKKMYERLVSQSKNVIGSAVQAKKLDVVKNPEKYKQIYKKLSDNMKKNNHMKGKRWYVPVDSNDINRDRRPFHAKEVPDGWISTETYKDSRKKRNSTYGKMWIHNKSTNTNKYINKGDNIPDGWVKGRIMNIIRDDTD